MTIEELIWDNWNIYHIARHNVKPKEVEEICESENFHISKSRNKTVRVIGQTNGGRYLVIFLAHKGKNSYYVVTARDAEIAERRLYKRK